MKANDTDKQNKDKMKHNIQTKDNEERNQSS